MLDAVVGYFSLARPVLGSARGLVHEVWLYSGVLAGTVGHWLFSLINGAAFAWGPLLGGAIASLVVFPTIWEKAGWKAPRGKAAKEAGFSLVKWCVAFQNGFFWPALLEKMSGA